MEPNFLYNFKQIQQEICSFEKKRHSKVISSHDPPVEDGGAGDSEGHHHYQVSQEGEGAEHEVGAGPESGLDHLHGGKWDLYFQNNKIFKCFLIMVFLVESQPFLSKGGTLRQQEKVL